MYVYMCHRSCQCCLWLEHRKTQRRFLVSFLSVYLQCPLHAPVLLFPLSQPWAPMAAAAQMIQERAQTLTRMNHMARVCWPDSSPTYTYTHIVLTLFQFGYNNTLNSQYESKNTKKKLSLPQFLKQKWKKVIVHLVMFNLF